MNRSLLAGLLLALAAALLLRCAPPEVRPLHNDEGVNAIKFAGLWSGRGYQYDPNEHHGPALPYASLVLARLTGARSLDDFSDRWLRALDVLFGAGLILLLPLLADGLGRGATLSAAGLIAVSPAMVFYSRYYIHEMLLVFFGLLAVAAVWRYTRAPRWEWALAAGAAVGLMQATKETFLINLIAAGMALAVDRGWRKWVDASDRNGEPVRIKPAHVAVALAAWGVVWVLLFSSFFSNPAGPGDSLLTYRPWFSRAGGASPHIHPWHFYLERWFWFRRAKGPLWTELFIALLALVGAVAGFSRRRVPGLHPGLLRFLALYTGATAAAYCLLAYKTPWCFLTPWIGAILLAGAGVVVVARRARRPPARLALGVVLAAGVAHLGFQAWRASVPYASSPANPYVYAQTLPGALDLVRQIKALAAVHPEGKGMLVKVIAAGGDYWPLPWYLRDLTGVGWYEALPPDPFAPVMVVSASFQAGLDAGKTHQMPGFFEFRPGVFFELYSAVGLWRKYIESRPRPKDDEADTP